MVFVLLVFSALFADIAKTIAQVVDGLASSRKLLLSTNKKLFWYDLDLDEETLLHETRGVYWGAFPGEPGENNTPTIWVMARPEKHSPKGNECLLRLSSNDSPAIVQEEIRVPSRMAHDVVRVGSSVLVASTVTGAIVELSYPHMKLRKEHQRFLRGDHLNTLSPVVTGIYDTGLVASAKQVWSLLHSRGKPSRLQLIDLTRENSGPLQEITGFGRGAHGAVQLGAEFNDDFLVCSSDEGRLMRVPIHGSKPHLVWQEPNRRFLKGLSVIEGVAYVGINGFNKVRKDTDMIAVNISSKELLWRRSIPSAQGVLNVISAPHLSIHSTYIAIPNWSVRTSVRSAGHSASPKDREL